MQRLEEALAEKDAALAAALTEIQQLEAERAKDKQIIAQLKAERPKMLPPDVFSYIMAIRAFEFRERWWIFHPPVETGLGLRSLYREAAHREWTPQMTLFYDVWMSCSPESNTHGGRKYGKMSPHHTYQFLGFAPWYGTAPFLDSAPFFRHLTMKRVFPLCKRKWEQLLDKHELTQALSNESPRGPKQAPKRKRAA